MLIRRAGREGISSLLEIEKESFDINHFPLSARCFNYHVRRNLLLVCEECGRRLYSLAVRRESRGKGVAKKLLCYSFSMLGDLKEFRLEVRCDNERAINLYLKNGFEIKGILKSYYPEELPDTGW